MSTTDSTEGSATPAGIFLDWGGEDFGARFGFHAGQTDLDDFSNGASADASGTGLYSDLRWAFD